MESERLRSVFRRVPPEDPTYEARLAEELALIERNAFTPVFLQVQRIMELCKELSIPHIIRGSAGSSLVCYLMGISHTDPLQYSMDLTRFMNHGRIDMPDIDIDIPYNRRDELYARIGKEWPGKVARISNHVMYKYKSAFQEALRLHAPTTLYKKGASVEEIVRNPETAAKIHAAIQGIVGTLKAESLHCGGIVVFEKEGVVPEELILKKTGILPQIKLDKDETEEAGYIKIDLLSSRGLAQQTEASGGRHVMMYPAADEKTAALLSVGKNIGITFAESRGMRHILKAMRPTGVEEIAIGLALIRPAAAAGGRKAAYLAAYRAGITPTKDLERPIIYDDDALARIRAVLTHNAPMEKEDADSIADRYRKAFAKERIGEMLRFRDVARRRGLPEPLVARIMEDLTQLKNYGFCKSHALSYAQLVWALAYEKAHNPHAFWVSALNHCHSEFRRWVHWREASSAGLTLTRGMPPYTLGKTRAGAPALLAAKGTQLVLIKDSDPSQIYEDMRSRGYWIAEEFYPGCYKQVKAAPQRRLAKGKRGTLAMEEKEYLVNFCGLIATGRVIYSETDGEESAPHTDVTMITIGYDNGKFMDLVIRGKKGYLLGFAAVEGQARTRYPDKDEGFEVQSIKGVGLRALSGRTPSL